jgi:hypothetical protein
VQEVIDNTVKHFSFAIEIFLSCIRIYVVLFIFVCYSCWMNVSCCYHSADFIIIFCKCLLCMEYRLICCPYWGIICTLSVDSLLYPSFLKPEIIWCLQCCQTLSIHCFQGNWWVKRLGNITVMVSLYILHGRISLIIL